jgi:N-acetylglucosaminyl-diphospho-decaprenol L-rhamnosyltransferase
VVTQNVTPERGAVGGSVGSSVDVVIVTHRSADVIEACLTSIVNSANSANSADDATVIASITVVDSADRGVTSQAEATRLTEAAVTKWNEAEARRVTATFVSLGINVGFGAAANRGAAHGRAPFLAILNPDIEMHDDCLSLLIARLQPHTSLAAVGPTVLDPSGAVYPSARSFPNLIDAAGHAFVGTLTPNNRWTRRYIGDPAHPDWISGTAILARRSAFDAVGGFDESYFMYVEDVDLCWRWARQGMKVGRVAEARLTHLIGASSSTAPVAMVIAHHRSLWRFACRSTRGFQRFALPLVFVGLLGRAGLVLVRQRVSGHSPATIHRLD